MVELLFLLSAGIGRTGTFIAMDHFLQAQVEKNVDVVTLVTSLRRQRMKMVQTLVSNGYIDINFPLINEFNKCMYLFRHYYVLIIHQSLYDVLFVFIIQSQYEFVYDALFLFIVQKTGYNCKKYLISHVQLLYRYWTDSGPLHSPSICVPSRMTM